jgi:hypothetical protein
MQAEAKEILRLCGIWRIPSIREAFSADPHPPIQAGLFKGDAARLDRAAYEFDVTLARLRAHV